MQEYCCAKFEKIQFYRAGKLLRGADSTVLSICGAPLYLAFLSKRSRGTLRAVRFGFVCVGRRRSESLGKFSDLQRFMPLYTTLQNHFRFHSARSQFFHGHNRQDLSPVPLRANTKSCWARYTTFRNPSRLQSFRLLLRRFDFRSATVTRLVLLRCLVLWRGIRLFEILHGRSRSEFRFSTRPRSATVTRVSGFQPDRVPQQSLECGLTFEKRA